MVSFFSRLASFLHASSKVSSSVSPDTASLEQSSSVDSARKRLETSVQKEKEKLLAEFSQYSSSKPSTSPFSASLSSIKGTELGPLVDSLPSGQRDPLLRRLASLHFSSQQEFFSSLVSELATLLKDDYKEILDRLSHLRKKGKVGKRFHLPLMGIPLKIALFSSTHSPHDFEKARFLLQRANSLLRPFEEATSEESS